MICVEGTLRTGSYADRNHPDVTHYTTDVFVDNVEFTGSKAESQGSSSYYAPQNNYNYQTPAQQAPATAQPANNNENLSFGDLGDFEEIIGDGDVPF